MSSGVASSAEAPYRPVVGGRPTILMLARHFHKGYEANGPTQSIVQTVRALSGRFRFRVIGAAAEDDVPGRWTEFLGVEQLPLTKSRFGLRGLRAALRETPADLIVLNSFFEPTLTILPLVLRRLGLLPDRPMLLAPRGEFSPGALALKSRKKRAYLIATRVLGLLKGVSFQATSEGEVARIRTMFGEQAPVCLAPTVRALPPPPPLRIREQGSPLRIAFLSRIDRMKNLDFALAALARAGVPTELNIFGLIHQADYWKACQREIAVLPPTAAATYRGVIAPDDVHATLAAHDLFILPSRGENFGHAIADALLAGTPVLVSDQTPWRGLREAGAGWDLPLDDVAPFADAIRAAARAGAEEQRTMRRAARAYGERRLDVAKSIALQVHCYEQAMALS